jgi:hypothetical protein
MMIKASEHVGRGFPPEEGKRLAQALLHLEVEWNGLEIDVSDLAPALLISAFFNGFLQEIHDRNSALLDKARSVKWIMQFPFQSENVDTWMKHFKPTK